MDTKSETRMKEFLARAQEAEEQAATCVQGSAERESWPRISFGYRDLARTNGYQG